MPSRVITTNPIGAFPEDSFKYSPLEHVRTLFVAFIQGLFKAAPPGSYHWEPEDQGEITIRDESPVKLESVGLRPAINVTRGPVQFYSLGLDDMMDYNFQTGSKTKTVLVPGTMTINCCSRVDLECERLAWIVGESLWLNRELLMRAGFFEIGRQPVFGAPSPAGSIVAGDNADEWFAVSVTCPFQFYRTSRVTPLGLQILQHIDLNLKTRILSVNNWGPEETTSSDLGVQVQGCPPPGFAPNASDANGATPNPGNSAPQLPTVPHPLNPSQQVTVRVVRPHSPVVKPPSIGGRSIPLSTTGVEESCEKQMDAHVAATSTVKV